jgi:hypothetical protein
MPRADYIHAVGDSQVAPGQETIYPDIVAAQFFPRRRGHCNLSMPGASSTQVADAFVAMIAEQPSKRYFPTIFDMGANNWNGTTQQSDIIVADLDRCVALCLGGFRIMQILPRSDRSSTTEPLRTILRAFDDRMITRYGSNYVRRLPVMQTEMAARQDKTAGDLTDIADDIIPRSMRRPADPIHRNQIGHNAEAKAVLASVTGGW